jgi:O-antigen ligase
VFFDPNIFGRYLALVMLLLTTLLLYDRRTKVQLGSILVLAILWTCLVFTLSRSSLVALALGMAVLAAFRWKTRPVVYLGVVAVIGVGVVLATHPSKFGLQNWNLASSGRANLISGGLRLFADHPLQGSGSGSFTAEYKSHFCRNAPCSVSDSHNIPITVAAEQGLIGELVYLALVIAALVALFRGARGDPYRVGIAATFVALLVHTMFYAAFLEDPVSWTLLAIGGSLAVAARANAEPERRERHLRAVA